MKSITKLLMLCFSIALSSCNQTQAETESNTYYIKIDSNNLRKVHVEAELNINSNMLSMNWPSVGWLEKGWSQFVENLEISDMNGKQIDYTYKDKAEWVLQTDEKRVKVTYDVSLTHDKVGWEEGGHSASTYVLDDFVYSIGAALFIANPVDELVIGAGEAAIVEFNLPTNYKLAIPWTPKEEGPNGYHVISTHELIRSGLSYGDMEKSVQNLEGMEVVISTANDFKEVIPPFREIYDQIVPKAVDYFDSSPNNGYVVIANKAPRTEEYQPYFSGEALHKTMSLISPIIPTEEYMPLFWYILTHEYIHNWMGITIQADAEEQTWFMEGFTDYISWHILHKVEQIPQEVIFNGIGFGSNSIGWGENIKKYLAVAGKINFLEAGKNKQDNYDLIYSGGSLFALILDIEMNAATNHKIGMKEFIREINKGFGEGSNRILTFQDIKDIASRLCGNNIDQLFDNYVEGKETIPVEEYLEKIGIEIKNFGEENQIVQIKEGIDENEKRLLERIIGTF